MSSSLQHRGVVERVSGDTVIVSVMPESACAGCHAKGICGERGDKREIVVKTPYASEYTPGERVIVALERNRMGVMSVVWSYVVPLVVLLGVLFVALHAFSRIQLRGSYMVVVRYEGNCHAEKKMQNFRRYRLKNKNMVGQTTELVAEVMLSKADMEKVEKLRQEEGVLEITIMQSVSGSVL